MSASSPTIGMETSVISVLWGVLAVIMGRNVWCVMGERIGGRIRMGFVSVLIIGILGGGTSVYPVRLLLIVLPAPMVHVVSPALSPSPPRTASANAKTAST